MNRYARRGPREGVEQQHLFCCIRQMEQEYPVLKRLYHVPNGGERNKAEAGMLWAEGVRAGVPDLCLPVPQLAGREIRFCGLYIELKREDGGEASREQKDWLCGLQDNFYRVALCRGAEEALTIICDYLRIERPVTGPAALLAGVEEIDRRTEELLARYRKKEAAKR